MQLTQHRKIRRKIPFVGTVIVDQVRHVKAHQHRNQFNQLIIVVEEDHRGNLEWGDWEDIPTVEENGAAIPELLTKKQFEELYAEGNRLHRENEEQAMLAAWPRISTILEVLRRSMWKTNRFGQVVYKTDKT